MKKNLIIAILFLISYSCLSQGFYVYNGIKYYTHKSFDEMMNPKDKVDKAIFARIKKINIFLMSLNSVDRKSKTFSAGEKYFYSSVCDSVLIYLVSRIDTTLYANDKDVNFAKRNSLITQKKALEEGQHELNKKLLEKKQRFSEKKYLKKESQIELKKRKITTKIVDLDAQVEELRPKKSVEKVINYLIDNKIKVKLLKGTEVVFKDKKNYLISGIYRDFYMFECIPLINVLYIEF